MGADLTHATTLPWAVWLVPGLPLLGAVINLFFGKRLGKWAGWLASATIGLSFLISIGLLVQMLGLPDEARTMTGQLYRWIVVGPMDVGITAQLDPLSMTMLLVVTGVGFLIHVYANGYMKGDERFGRFFAYLNLFVFFMLVLVLAGDYVLLYVGWEGVGLCSFLLIGFWFEKPSASAAAKKAFIVTRIGDTLMLIGLALMFVQFGTFAFARVLDPAVVETIGSSTRTAIAILLLCGAIGKSAQLPLHVWLPDAMEGPTPVSALIHAATMVTAGVYLVVRSAPLFTPTASTVVMIVGLASALYGAMASIGQDDMKRALAYSTMSQLGYMFFAAGLGIPALAIAMLVVHAVYKSLMFLGAGSVMHATDGVVDMKRLGGLRRLMPVTAITFAIGAYALSGLPPLAGFFAKDPIIAFADEHGDVLAWAIAVVAAFLSAMYISRIAILAFAGKRRDEQVHAHESPRVMLVPLILLGMAALLIELITLSPETGVLEVFLEPVVGAFPEHGTGIGEPWLTIIGVLAAVAGVAVSWLWYGRDRDWISARQKDPAWHRALASGFGINAAYDKMVDPVLLDGAQLLADIDANVIDGAVNGVGRVTIAGAASGRRWQTGLVRTYALSFAFGVAILLFFFAVVR